MPIIATTMERAVNGPLRAAAASAHDALAVSHQMMDMLREYARLEAEHADRMQQFAHRMGDCVDRMRASPPCTHSNQDEGDDRDSEENQLLARQSQCVAVMDEVVTFVTRFSSMHRHLSECITSDLFDEWVEVLDTQQTRMDDQEPDLHDLSKQLEIAKTEYAQTHETFRACFDHACAVHASVSNADAINDNEIESKVQQLLDESSPPASRRRSSSAAAKFVGSLSRNLIPSRRRSITSNQKESVDEALVDAFAEAERSRQQCREAYQSMHRLQIRHARLCDSLYQEYQCVQSECLASTRTSIRKLSIHLSAFTSNLQYDATQLFQHVEALHGGQDQPPYIHHSPFTTAKVAASVLAPPTDRALTLKHLQQHRLPTVDERPRLLRHQNARLALVL